MKLRNRMEMKTSVGFTEDDLVYRDVPPSKKCSQRRKIFKNHLVPHFTKSESG